MTETMENNLPRVAEIAIVITMAWLFAGWLVPEQKQVVENQQLSETAEQVSVDLASMASVMLFGEPAKEPVKKAPEPVAAPKPAPAPVSRLNVKLLGTVVAGSHSAAVMTLDGKQEQQVFFQGDEIKPSVKLEAVYADAIVVDNHGKSEKIMMQEDAKLPRSAVAPAAVSQPPVRAPNTDQLHQRVNRGHLNNQLRDFSTLLSQARVIPNFKNGKADGFVITAIVPGSLYEQIGLQNGDVIRQVNGEKIVSAQQAMQMYQQLQNATSISLALERNGQPQEIYYDIQ